MSIGVEELFTNLVRAHAKICIDPFDFARGRLFAAKRYSSG
jgi:hypothetical protein